ncbi:MAG: purine-nucleoside phosphorylase [Candidatus Micrarchaeia archaeon]
MPIHIRAKEGDIAERVLVGGDPARIRALSKLLDGAKIVNENRGFLAYTGKFNGKRVTLATHGIGQPSIAIVIEELAQLGAKKIVRLGTCGGLRPDIKVGDLVVVSGATYAHGSTVTQYTGSDLGNFALAQTPDFELTERLVDALKEKGVKYIITNTFSSDSFYSLKDETAKALSKFGNDVVEMEIATLFMLGKAKALDTAALLVVSDNVVRHTKLYTHEELEKTVMLAGRVVLEALTR